MSDNNNSAKYDLFNETGLSFDLPTKKGVEVQDAIEKTIKRFETELSQADVYQKKELNDKIQWIKEIQSIILDGSKITDSFLKLAEEKTEQVKEKLTERIKMGIELRKSSNKSLTVTMGSINDQRKKTRLSKKTVEAVYTECGYAVLKGNAKANAPGESADFKKIHDDLKQFRGIPEINPNALDKSKLTDIYNFIAYLNGEPEKGTIYRSKSIKELAKLAEKVYRDTSDQAGLLIKEILALGKTKVFDTEENRTAYNQYVLYVKPEMQKLMRYIEGASSAELEDSDFADACIKKITEVFGDSDVALAIYNAKSGMDYVPDTSKPFGIKCSKCGAISQFTSPDEAKVKNECQNCHEPIYRTCNGCGEKIPLFEMHCPNCGFVFASAALFGRYLSDAKKALAAGQFTDARDALEQAKIANPQRASETIELERQIEEKEKQYAEPLGKLKRFIFDKQFEAAGKYMSYVLQTYPQLNVDSFAEKIEQTLSLCRIKFESSKSLGKDERINASVEILKICRDFESAIEFLRTTPPAACLSINSAADNVNGGISVSWKSPNEGGITFKLLRKNGKTPSANDLDGTIICDDIVTSSYKDLDVVPGEMYTYTVFSKRGDSISSPISTSATLLLKVTDIKYTQTGNTIHLTWVKPTNCSSVSVTRSCEGNDVTIASNAQNGVDDSSTQYNKDYIYKIIANYKSGTSAEAILSVKPTVIIDDFSIDVTPNKDGTHTLKWSIRQDGVDIQVFVADQINQSTRSDLKKCKLELPQNGVFKVSAKAFSGGKWIDSKNSINVNTYASCGIDSKSVQIKEVGGVYQSGNVKRVEIKFSFAEPIQPNVKGFVYFVKTKDGKLSQAPWVTTDDYAKATGGIRVMREAYDQNKQIMYQTSVHDEDAFYVTVFSIFDINGTETQSAPYMKKLNRPLHADIFWKMTKPLFGGTPKLALEIRANRPFSRRPELVLCTSNGAFLLSPNDNSAIRLVNIPEKQYSESKEVNSEVIEIDSTHTAISKKQKLFLFKNEEDGSGEFTLRWADGFKGRL